jgi:hypothetical protein
MIGRGHDVVHRVLHIVLRGASIAILTGTIVVQRAAKRVSVSANSSGELLNGAIAASGTKRSLLLKLRWRRGIRPGWNGRLRRKCKHYGGDGR